MQAAASVAALLRAGRVEDAERAVSENLAACPTDPEHYRAAGIVSAWRHDWEQARAAFERALSLQTADQSWWRDIGLALLGAGDPAGARQIFERILAGEFDAPEALTLVHYGEALELLNRDADARGAFLRAAELDPADPAPYEGLLRTCGRLCADEQALRFARRAARLHYFKPQSLQLLADAQFQAGNLAASLRIYRRARRRDPGSAEIYAGHLFASLHDPAQTPQSLKCAHEEWFNLFGGERRCGQRFPNSRDADRPLRIGYVSGEFQVSPTQFFLLPLLQAHDSRQFVTYCYHTSRFNDEVTQAYQRAASHWRDLPGGCARRVRDAVLADEIDILVGASGPFYPKVLPVFQMRSAPVQVALPVYPSTTGCREIDYLISDRWTTPPDGGFASQYSEGEVFRVPSGYVLYGPPENAPAISAPPLRANGYVTFGLFQRPAKYNRLLWEGVIAILSQTPGSHLLVHYASTDLDAESSAVRAGIAEMLVQGGIRADRLEFAGRRGVFEHLGTVARADIALDTFPYSGHTTTCDSLWMGVPVVSIAGSTHAGRVSASLLARLGLSEWITHNLEGYIGCAVSAASEVDKLEKLRASLRTRMSESTICRHETVVREMEAGFRAMWRRWCAQR